MYHYGAPQQFAGYPTGHGKGSSFTLIVVLFILLVVVGSAYIK
ncbi:YjcZ family sporulation protein [Anaerobacillus sp. CMMVII]|nr:YjcZ family sporulation protein [Anaerobacillus sp. CMMVII]MCT8138296.1 YjcZ family sporulation protein [Anaerobacillus sp. CMMVII]